jgi:hypothetical protein
MNPSLRQKILLIQKQKVSGVPIKMTKGSFDA